MQLEQFLAADERPVRAVPGPEGERIVADLGQGADATVDVVGETVIVVHDDGEFDVELGEAVDSAVIQNGVLTIDLEDDA